MLKVKLITVGTLKEDYLRSAAAEYEKRLGEVSAERDEARRALAALREALLAIRRLAETA